jgi:putative methyltransferase (TIGR04325 family)
MLERLHHAVDRAAAWPGVRHWRRRRFDAGFDAGGFGGTCRGIYESYDQAAAAAPHTLPLGYDHERAADLYRDRLERVFPSDYPMMFWLQRAFAAGARQVFDLGGHVGVSYYAYQRYLDFPADCTWTVCDVPAVLQAAAGMARQRDAHGRLRFTECFEQARDADVLFTSGCAQYLPETLAQRLASLDRLPPTILINLLPLHDHDDFWTVQSIGAAFCPYHIQQFEHFFIELAALGYTVQDRWENLEKRCQVAFDPAHSLDRYWGAELTLRGKPSALTALH